MNDRERVDFRAERRYEREVRVKAIKAEVKQGTYRIDPRAVAEVMVGKELTRLVGYYG